MRKIVLVLLCVHGAAFAAPARDIQHIVDNHDVEIKMLESKLENLQSAVEATRQQFNDSKQQSREAIKSTSQDIEGRLNGFAGDIKVMRNRMGDLEKAIQAQNENISHLQAALKALMEALQPPAIDDAGKVKIYKIKSGDSLEKIAKINQTTVNELRKLNNMEKDRIISGQSLKVPDK